MIEYMIFFLSMNSVIFGDARPLACPVINETLGSMLCCEPSQSLSLSHPKCSIFIPRSSFRLLNMRPLATIQYANFLLRKFELSQELNTFENFLPPNVASDARRRQQIEEDKKGIILSLKDPKRDCCCGEVKKIVTLQEGYSNDGKKYQIYQELPERGQTVMQGTCISTSCTRNRIVYACHQVGTFVPQYVVNENNPGYLKLIPIQISKSCACSKTPISGNPLSFDRRSSGRYKKMFKRLVNYSDPLDNISEIRNNLVNKSKNESSVKHMLNNLGRIMGRFEGAYNTVMTKMEQFYENEDDDVKFEHFHDAAALIAIATKLMQFEIPSENEMATDGFYRTSEDPISNFRSTVAEENQSTTEHNSPYTSTVHLSNVENIQSYDIRRVEIAATDVPIHKTSTAYTNVTTTYYENVETILVDNVTNSKPTIMDGTTRDYINLINLTKSEGITDVRTTEDYVASVQSSIIDVKGAERTTMGHLTNNLSLFLSNINNTQYTTTVEDVTNAKTLYEDDTTNDTTLMGVATTDTIFWNEESTDALFRDEASTHTIIPDEKSTDTLSRDGVSTDALFRDGASTDTIFPDGVSTDTIFPDGASTDTIFPDGVNTDTVSRYEGSTDTVFRYKGSNDTIIWDEASSDTIVRDEATTDTTLWDVTTLRDGTTTHTALQDVTTTGAALQDVTTTGVALQDVTTTDATLRNVRNTDSTLQDAITTDAAFRDVTITSAALRNVTTTDTTLRDVTTSGATLRDITTIDATFWDVTTFGATLRDVTTTDATLRNVARDGASTNALFRDEASTDTVSRYEGSTDTVFRYEGSNNTIIRDGASSDTIVRDEATTDATLWDVTTLRDGTTTDTVLQDVTTTDATLRDVTTTDATLRDVTTTDATLRDVTITGATLRDVTTTSATLWDVTSTDDTLQDVTITDATLRDVMATGATLRDVTNTGATLRDVTSIVDTLRDVTSTDDTFQDVISTDAALRDVMITDATLQDVTTTDASLRDVMSTDAALRDVTTTGATLWDVTSTDATLQDVTTTDTSLRDVMSTGATLRDVTTTDATLRDVTTTDATLQDVTTTDAYLQDVTMTDTTLRDVTTDTTLRDVKDTMLKKFITNKFSEDKVTTPLPTNNFESHSISSDYSFNLSPTKNLPTSTDESSNKFNKENSSASNSALNAISKSEWQTESLKVDCKVSMNTNLCCLYCDCCHKGNTKSFDMKSVLQDCKIQKDDFPESISNNPSATSFKTKSHSETYEFLRFLIHNVVNESERELFLFMTKKLLDSEIELMSKKLSYINAGSSQIPFLSDHTEKMLKRMYSRMAELMLEESFNLDPSEVQSCVVGKFTDYKVSPITFFLVESLFRAKILTCQSLLDNKISSVIAASEMALKHLEGPLHQMQQALRNIFTSPVMNELLKLLPTLITSDSDVYMNKENYHFKPHDTQEINTHFEKEFCSTESDIPHDSNESGINLDPQKDLIYSDESTVTHEKDHINTISTTAYSDSTFYSSGLETETTVDFKDKMTSLPLADYATTERNKYVISDHVTANRKNEFDEIDPISTTIKPDSQTITESTTLGFSRDDTSTFIELLTSSAIHDKRTTTTSKINGPIDETTNVPLPVLVTSPKYNLTPHSRMIISNPPPEYYPVTIDNEDLLKIIENGKKYKEF